MWLKIQLFSLGQGLDQITYFWSLLAIRFMISWLCHGLDQMKVHLKGSVTALRRFFLGDKTLPVTFAVWLKTSSHECWQCDPTVIWAAVELSLSPLEALSLRYVFQIQGNEKEVLIRYFAWFKKCIWSY